MKICFLSSANSAHTKKWCKWFAGRGHEVHVVSFIDGEVPGAAVHTVDTGASADGGDAQKLRYLLAARRVRRIIRDISPDTVNVHYATSYGMTAALSGVRGYILSVWGSDIYDFPNKSPIHRAMLKFSLSRAERILSTSRAMAEETRKYTGKEIAVTPFGVDTELFSPEKRQRADGDGKFVIGTVKTLSPKYGIDRILRAAATVKEKRSDIDLRVRIAGDGELAAEYRALAEKLGIADITEWLGFITQERAAGVWADMDVAVVPSVLASESFGVSAVEAEACGVPVVISDIPGLMEATCPGKSSTVIKGGDPEGIADALIDLYSDREKRLAMGRAGREYVLENYRLDDCFLKVERIFEELLQDKTPKR